MELPTGSAASPLEQLAAAITVVDPGAMVLSRSPRAIRLQTEGLEAVETALIDVESLAQLETDAKETAAAFPKGKMLRLVACDAAGLGAGQALAPLAKALKGARVVHALTWSPTEAPKKVWGSGSWAVLTKAAERLRGPGIGDARALLTAREALSAEVSQFLGPIKARKAVVTWTLAGISAALFALQMLWGSGEPYASGLRMGASVNSLIAEGQWWRLVAPMVLHGSWGHLLVNLMALFSFGTFLERYLGSSRYLLLYVASGIGGTVGSFFRTTDVISVGASGGIWGLMIAGAVLVTWSRGRLPELVTVAQRKKAWLPVVINGFYSFQPGVDLLAHLGGGIIGGLLMFSGVLTSGLPRPGETVPARTSKPLAIASASSAVLLLVSVAVALVTGRPWELTGAPALSRAIAGDTGISLDLPPLIGASRWSEADKRHAFGSLQYDPVAFEVLRQVIPLSAEEAEATDATMDALATELNSHPDEGKDGFKRASPYEVRRRGEQLLVRGARSSANGITMTQSWVLHEGRLLVVIGYWGPTASPHWRAAVDEVPWTARLARAP